MDISPNNLFLAPCSRTNKEGTYRHFVDTVEDGLDPTAYSGVPEFEQDRVAVWGVVGGNEAHWRQMEPGDVVLFYTKTKVYTHIGRVIETQENAELADQIWTTYDEGRRVKDIDEPWPYIFYLTDIKEVNIPSEDFHADIGWNSYYPQSFTRVVDERRQLLIDRYGSLAAALRHHRTETAVEDPEEFEEETEDLLSPPTEEPALTGESSYTEEKQKTRSRAFREAVRQAYDETCAFCGAQRKTISGTPEVEAAHIYPKSEDGIDAVQNGIALCKFHHWAFDTGWAAVDDDFEIMIRDRPEQESYRSRRRPAR
jgi:putative restriction endonuclease